MENPPDSNEFTSTRYFPSRRRVWQACTNCRNRKTRCDAAKPRCSLCTTMDTDCIYKDSQQPRIEHNTRIMLERIQALEDRIFSSGVVVQPAQAQTQDRTAQPRNDAEHDPSSFGGDQQNAMDEAPDGDTQIEIPISHTANGNHVLNWPIVRQLLRDSGILATPSQPLGDMPSTAATDIFFRSNDYKTNEVPPESWRLFQHHHSQGPPETPDRLRDCIHTYFEQVNVFFPLLSLDAMNALLDRKGPENQELGVPLVAEDYALLLLVLCLGQFVRSGGSTIHLPSEASSFSPQDEDPWAPHSRLWEKARLLLGFVSSKTTLEAAQCSMLASLYMGARGRVSDASQWAHATAVKCEALAKKYLMERRDSDAFPEAFRRLFWVAYIYEGDFVAEIPMPLPSGISRYEESVPYPTRAQPSTAHMGGTPGSEVTVPGTSTFDRTEELVPFQISTNAAIRRFLNRIQNVVYDSKDYRSRMTRANYANWLLRIAEDLWSHHSAIYRNLPDFLLKSQPAVPHFDQASSPDTPGIQAIPELANNPWNVLRLEGRYYAAQYIIHRPFIEYVLLNLDHFETHPCREDIQRRCRLCLQGCKGFINVFDRDPANSITSLFASGLVTFTMVIILRVASVCPPLQAAMPGEIEDVISTGKRNLKRFSGSVREFRWHMEVLDQLDLACQGLTTDV
ncbi:hypothetical protein F5X68DRAFT_266897 [Plectosphaerella plurivora]|uniref:Zn(2)-C6 fungal-type domain-containing protein n=1 Tax=Plectosphaerella plurivora TaxID=936078 RepID=A0A9P9AHJ8_9PEZI|nr:hypothetical protein F5X68DRAFT_266897 [Plectosphaerella plurivora]